MTNPHSSPSSGTSSGSSPHGNPSTRFGVASNPQTGFFLIIDHNEAVIIDHNGEAISGGDFTFIETTESNPHA